MTTNSTGWVEGPFDLTLGSINSIVTKKSPGAYALGRKTGDTFYVAYVGRSDKDLADRLRNWVGQYTHFKAAYYETPHAAFLKECELYHNFSGLDNKIHPDRPQGTNWTCPYCKLFG